MAKLFYDSIIPKWINLWRSGPPDSLFFTPEQPFDILMMADEEKGACKKTREDYDARIFDKYC